MVTNKNTCCRECVGVNVYAENGMMEVQTTYFCSWPSCECHKTAEDKKQTCAHVFNPSERGLFRYLWCFKCQTSVEEPNFKNPKKAMLEKLEKMKWGVCVPGAKYHDDHCCKRVAGHNEAIDNMIDFVKKNTIL